MKNKHSTKEAIDASITCLLGGMPNLLVKHHLIQDGFDNKKANTILRWAQLYIKRKYYE